MFSDHNGDVWNWNEESKMFVNDETKEEMTDENFYQFWKSGK